MKSGAGSTSESLEELKRLHHEALTSKADSDQARAEAVAAAAIAQAQAAAASSAAAVDRRARQLADEQVKKLTAALATAEEALKTLAAEQPDGPTVVVRQECQCHPLCRYQWRIKIQFRKGWTSWTSRRARFPLKVRERSSLWQCRMSRRRQCKYRPG